MKWQQFTINILERISQEMDRFLDGLTLDDLNKQPKPDTNSMGWLAWHLTRCQDRAIAELSGKEQLWVKDGWHAKFNRPADPDDIGVGHTPKDLAAFKSPDVPTQLAYHHAVLEQSRKYINGISEKDLDRELGNPRFPTVAVRLVGIMNDNYQHVGQIAYIRGLLKGMGWWQR